MASGRTSVRCQKHRFASCPSSWRPARPLRSWPTIAPPITRQAHSCPPSCTAGPHKPFPTRHQTDGKPSQPAPNLPTRFPISPATPKSFTNLLGSPPLSRPRVSLHHFAAGPKCLSTFSKPRAFPTRFAAGPECPPTRIRSDLSFRVLAPVTFHTQVSSDAQFRASAANPEAPDLYYSAPQSTGLRCKRSSDVCFFQSLKLHCLGKCLTVGSPRIGTWIPSSTSTLLKEECEVRSCQSTLLGGFAMWRKVRIQSVDALFIPFACCVNIYQPSPTPCFGRVAWRQATPLKTRRQ